MLVNISVENVVGERLKDARYEMERKPLCI
jgi:hypothetical protein